MVTTWDDTYSSTLEKNEDHVPTYGSWQDQKKMRYLILKVI